MCDRDEDTDDEIDDQALEKILIITQTPPPPSMSRKHPSGDRTGDFLPRAKMTADLAKIINDGLFYYEQDLWEESVKVLKSHNNNNNNKSLYSFIIMHERRVKALIRVLQLPA